MIVQKVFAVSSKSIQQKPPYIKPKHRTYRQLLELDKPKKIFLDDSDNENDDFLQKLMKKQEKEQKQAKKKLKSKKSMMKNQPSQKSESQSAKKSQLLLNTGDNFLKKRIVTPGDEGNQLSQKFIGQIDKKLIDKQNSNQIAQHNPTLHSNPIIKRLQSAKANGFHTSNQRLRTSSKTNLWQNINLKSIIKNNSDKKRNLFLQGKESLPAVIRLSLDGNQAGIVKNQFIVSMRGKKGDGVRALHEEIHRKQSLTNHRQNESIELLTRLSPDKNQIHHSFSPKKSQKSLYSKPTQFLLKSAISPPVQMLLMAKTSPQKKTHIRIKQKLFKTSQQQELFLRSLKKSQQ